MVDREEIELAWAAGFFDGEGNTRIHHDSRWKSSRIFVSLSQVEREPLDRFCTAVGVGKVYGPYGGPSEKSPNKQPHYMYAVWGIGAEVVVGQLIPYLCTAKTEQALKVFHAYYPDHATLF
jgi:hypothetical protein